MGSNYLLHTTFCRSTGTEDMRAEEGALARSRRPFSEMTDMFPRIFNDVSPTACTEDAASRVKAPGYRYMPVSRETYGYSPSREQYVPSERPSRRIPTSRY